MTMSSTFVMISSGQPVLHETTADTAQDAQTFPVLFSDDNRCKLCRVPSSTCLSLLSMAVCNCMQVKYFWLVIWLLLYDTVVNQSNVGQDQEGLLAWQLLSSACAVTCDVVGIWSPHAQVDGIVPRALEPGCAQLCEGDVVRLVTAIASDSNKTFRFGVLGCQGLLLASSCPCGEMECFGVYFRNCYSAKTSVSGWIRGIEEQLRVRLRSWCLAYDFSFSACKSSSASQYVEQSVVSDCSVSQRLLRHLTASCSDKRTHIAFLALSASDGA